MTTGSISIFYDDCTKRQIHSCYGRPVFLKKAGHYQRNEATNTKSNFILTLSMLTALVSLEINNKFIVSSIILDNCHILCCTL